MSLLLFYSHTANMSLCHCWDYYRYDTMNYDTTTCFTLIHVFDDRLSPTFPVLSQAGLGLQGLDKSKLNLTTSVEEESNS